MKILFVGHDITYARFYEAIQLSMVEEFEVSATHVYFRPSAWLYAKYIKKFKVFTTAILKKTTYHPNKRFQETSNLDLLFYGGVINVAQKNKFENLFMEYCNFFNQLLKKDDYDIVILPGEFRLFEQAVIAEIKLCAKPIKMLFMEAGPQGYIYFDEVGVNANASFATSGFNKLNMTLKNSQANINLKPVMLEPLTKKLRYLLLCADIFWIMFNKIIGDQIDLEEYWVALQNRTKKIFISPEKKIKKIEGDKLLHSVLFLGQVSKDVNHTHFGVSGNELADRIIRILQDDKTIKIIWRDHPYERLDDLFLRVTENYPGRVYRSKSPSLNDDFNKCEGVITVNSNGGLEALKCGLPVLLLGSAYYATLSGVCKDSDSFKKYRNSIRVKGHDKFISNSANKFLKECFLPIDYRSENFDNAHLAAKLIVLNK
jgi:capsule polysaccharide modification protein KpsS